MPYLALLVLLGASVAVASAAADVAAHGSQAVEPGLARSSTQLASARHVSTAYRLSGASADGGRPDARRWLRSVSARRRALLEEGAAAAAAGGAGAAAVADADAASNPLASATHPEVGLDALFVPRNVSCDPRCTARGNCNAEDGTCECPFGYTGPTCETPLMPACQVGPDLEPFFGMMVPRSCECARQASRFFGCSADDDTCRLYTMNYHDIRCYEFRGRPAEQQWSAMPLEGAEGVDWFIGSVQRAPPRLNPTTAAEGVLGFDIWGRPHLSLPLDRCGERHCHNRGACIIPLQSGKGGVVDRNVGNRSPHCLCYKGYMGHTCGDPMNSLCPNECRGRGVCLRGFCHCRPPYWGLDCSRQRAWALAPGVSSPVPNRVRLRIYVYDLPANVNLPHALDDNVFDLNEPSYQTHRRFLELLLRDPEVRTENPAEANLFFVPATAYSYVSNINPPTYQLIHALDYVSRRYPWFNASGGRDHFVWTTGDRGSCYVPTGLSRVIHVTLFGLHADLNPGGHNGSTFLNPQPLHHRSYACFHPKKDVLAAPWYDHMVGSTEAPDVYRKVVEAGGQAPERDLLFFFAGSIRPNDPSYSGGARQALAEHLKGLLGGPDKDSYKDVQFIEGYTPDYEALYARSRFCLAPHGAGFGVRLTLAMTHACIPVIIQDSVYQPYEADGLLPYPEFSLRLGKADVAHIVPILRAIPPDKQARMRLAMAKYHKAFLWEPWLGGRAYHYTVAALEQRLGGLWGRLWGSGSSGGAPASGGGSGRRRRQALEEEWAEEEEEEEEEEWEEEEGEAAAARGAGGEQGRGAHGGRGTGAGTAAPGSGSALEAEAAGGRTAGAGMAGVRPGAGGEPELGGSSSSSSSSSSRRRGSSRRAGRHS
ncbi:hypothetical protein HYH02_006996 [Chlamydomonas schloesseri]|uniref:EGF-like domain-containing protein n=1 Tax=Chlamydomonas schloesseri TaxID=2026947 RepID=A0A836B583_9CHLO|nr:hypothetical protein HYH02_006996 [Chlamydomonas schloesseri]|eukprot:KAG2447967.1 hypothetical protein HYH02_006996 [Chlamydomonas schloesseri]